MTERLNLSKDTLENMSSQDIQGLYAVWVKERYGNYFAAPMPNLGGREQEAPVSRAFEDIQTSPGKFSELTQQLKKFYKNPPEELKQNIKRFIQQGEGKKPEDLQFEESDRIEKNLLKATARDTIDTIMSNSRKNQDLNFSADAFKALTHDGARMKELKRVASNTLSICGNMMSLCDLLKQSLPNYLYLSEKQ